MKPISVVRATNKLIVETLVETLPRHFKMIKKPCVVDLHLAIFPIHPPP